MDRRWVGVLVLLLVLALPGAAASSFPWSGFPVPGASVGAYPIRLDGVEQNGNLAVVTWDVPPNCLSGYGTVLVSRDGSSVSERVSLGRLKPWGKKVAVFFNVREPIYVKLLITAGNGVFMSSWVRLEPSYGPYTVPAAYGTISREVRPQFIPALIGAIVIVGTTVWNLYDMYKACTKYGVDSVECRLQGAFVVVGLALSGEEDGFKIVSKLGEKFGVSEKIYSVLKRVGVVDDEDNVLRRFFGIFDDVVKHGDDAAEALDDLAEAGVSTEAIEEAVNEGVSLSALKDVVEHGATPKEVAEGIQEAKRVVAKHALDERITSNGLLYVVGEVNGYAVGVIGDSESEGLIHILLRHVWGYKMTSPSNPITTFWPLGQRIVVNGEVKQLPMVFDSEGELMEFLNDVLKKALEDSDYRKQFFKNGVPNKNFKILVDLKKLGMHVDGIDVVKLEFKFEDGAFVLKTAYPKEGWAVETFIPGNGGWQ